MTNNLDIQFKLTYDYPKEVIKTTNTFIYR